MPQDQKSQRRWTPEEIERLYEMVGFHPTIDIVRELEGRTEQAVRKKILKLGLSARTELDYLTLSSWAKLLKIPSFIVFKAKRRGLIETRKIAKYYYLASEELYESIKQYPEHWVGIDAEAAEEAIGKPVRELLEDARYSAPQRQSVKNLTTGDIYYSAGAAAEALGCCAKSIDDAAKSKGRHKGFLWTYTWETNW